MLVNDDIHALSGAVSGIVAVPNSPEFAEETFAFNAATVHRPDVVLGAADAQDVAAGVKWAAERRLQEVQIDPVERTARVGAGVKWRTVLEASVPQGLIGLIGLHGSSTDVGVVGYTVGGGLPVLGRAHGFAADHVRSMEVVTADGALRRIDAEAEAELFALMCGGKGNFGIVTALEFNLFPLENFYGGGIIYPGADAAAVLTAFREWLPTLPDEASPSISLLRLPDMEFVPQPLRGQFVNYLDVDQVHMEPADPLPFTDAGALLKEFGEEAAGELLRLAGDGTDCPLLMIEIRPLGGALSRGGVLPDAVSGRDAAFLLFLLGFKLPPVLPAVTESIHAILAAMAPYSTGYTLVNFHGEPGDEADRARA